MKLNGSGIKIVAGVMGTLLCAGALLWGNSWSTSLNAAEGDIVKLREGQIWAATLIETLVIRMDQAEEERGKILSVVQEMNGKLADRHD